MGSKNVNEFKSGDEILGFYLIKGCNLKTSSNNKRFLDLTLCDNTGEINAKLWDATDNADKIYAVNKLVKIKGSVTEWQGNLQLRVDKIRPSTDNDNVNIENFVPAAPVSGDILFEEMMDFINNIENNDIKKVVSILVNENKAKLLIYPAAMKNHHAIRSGLLYHINRMLKTAQKLCEVYPLLNSDLLYAGVILHDLAKLDEMDAEELGIVSDYTMEGYLLGHITQGIKNIDKVSRENDVDEEISIILQHMVLSHHYEPEFGSPKRPMIPEAEILHYLDMIDARMYDMEKILKDTETGDFSDKIWVLHNRKLYNRRFDK